MYHNGLNLNMYSHSTRPLGRYPDLHNQYLMHAFYFYDIDLDLPIKKMNKKDLDIILYGSPDLIEFNYTSKNGQIM